MINNIYSNNGYDFFEKKFKNKEDLITYLKNAKTSVNFASTELSSFNTSDYEWYQTKSFEEALKFFECGWYENFDNFLIQKKQIDKFFPFVSEEKSLSKLFIW